ncbi:hypothetical protein [Tsukamurella paurometabola]|uniref:PH domain-containing protein n=1 Tax=Tsukamurella paurometabola TaxID=2061 RepID=A0ABS5N844_TSUPA|nr:hypothetical protein [Tsukamurella paurometabola]MBS4100195.1 hypothetical protein [Tsukamurella paurometabola]
MHPTGPGLPQRPFPPIQHQWIAGPSDATRAAWAVARAMMWNKPMWVLYAVIAALTVWDFTRMGWLGLFSVVVFSLALGLLFLVYFGYYLSATKALLSPGATWATGFGPAELSLINPISTSVIDYAAITGARRVGPVVVIRYRGGVLYDGIPSQLVPERDFEMLRRAAKTK